ncbi:MAG: Na+/H+ antiporter NhaA [Gammaproteobacteria bacterium]|nr:Na+/H+ antiporter NhaA [Gammaproteobacteria bacterium]
MLMGAAVLAMLVANSSWSGYYDALLAIPFTVMLGDFGISKPILLWINDGLMAVFFFLIGLELKRELLEGELSDLSKLTLPGMAAIAGMLVPAAVFSFFNWGDAVAMQGWAIPAATDIAFALGVLALLGDRVPTGLKVFLLSVAILDDIGAIIVIALFYTSNLSVASLSVAAACIVVLALMSWRGVRSELAYLLVGIVLWTSVLKSGVHATLAGVVLAFFIPITKDGEGYSPLRRLEDDLHGPVAFAILPIFAFANAGVSLAGSSAGALLEPLPLGIALGLILGKQVGIFSMTWLGARLGWGSLPEGVTWRSLYGLSVLCGIGFTMSLFISSLAFEESSVNTLATDRLGVLAGTLVSALWGYVALRMALPTGPAGSKDS